MGAINPSKMPSGKRKARRDDTDFTEYAEGGDVEVAPKAETPKVKPQYSHEVVDNRTGQVMGQYQSANTARRGADRLDNKYGGYRYTARPIGSGGKGGGKGGGMLDELLAEGGSVGLYANINRKRERIAAGSGEKMRRAGQKGAPTAEAFKRSAKTAKR